MLQAGAAGGVQQRVPFSDQLQAIWWERQLLADQGPELGHLRIYQSLINMSDTYLIGM